MKRVTVCTGAGISAESGLGTFRDSDGLWENYPIEEVATPEGWERNPDRVLHFYNLRRKQVLEAVPNPAHLALAELQSTHDVRIITQNIDDLHERAGSRHVLHLHGEIRKSRSSIDPSLVYPIEGWELRTGEVCELGSQLRPHVVWFGEPVPEMDAAYPLVEDADVFIVIGTSLAVYPAASLVHCTGPGSERYFIDPAAARIAPGHGFTVFAEPAGVAVPKLVKMLQQAL